MAIDQLARGLAASAQGGGGGVVDVNIKEGVGIHVETQGDDVTISNLGVTNITASDTDAEDGTVKVVFGADSSKNKNVPVKGLKAGAYKAVDTKVDATTKDSTNVPTTKAVYDSIKGKVDSSAVGDTIATLDSTKKLPTTQLPAHNHNASEVTAMTNYKIADEASAITQTDSLNAAIGKLEKAIEGKMPGGKNYAGASTDGGAATSAEKLTNTTAIGSTTKGVYFDANGLPKPMTYELNKTVPSNAEFTDTKYTADTNSGISVNADTKKISNTGVRSISESSNDGKIGFNLNGTDKEVQVKGFKDFILKKLDTPATSYAAQYQLFSRKDNTGEYTAVADSATIDIPKDLVVESGDVKTCTVANVPVSGYKVGDKYIDLVIANIDNKHIYIPVNALVDDKAEGISYSNATSKLTAKNVQAAIDEVVTKIGALDQSKLDKTAVLSEIPPSLSPVTVLSAQLSLDTFTKKSAIESVANNTRIITVPEDVDCFAGIGMIGGKTVKGKNLLNHTLTNGSKSVGDAVVSWVVNDDKSITITLTGTTTDAVSIPLLGGWNSTVEVLPNDTYTVMWANPNEPKRSTVQIKTVNVTTSIANEVTPTNKISTFTGAPTYIYIRISNGISLANPITVYPMIVKGTHTELLPYEKYFEGLHSAPVESVVSQGRNLITDRISNASINSGGKIFSTTDRDIFIAEVKSGTQYCFSNDNTCLVAWYKEYPKLDGVSYNMSRETPGIKTVVSPIDGYVAISFAKTISSPMISYGNVLPNYSEPYKTTISLDEIINNLPDYGASVSDEIYNYIDFEDGYYHHKVAAFDFKTTVGGYNDIDKYFYISNAPKKYGASNAISSRYTIGSVDVGVGNLPSLHFRGNSSSANMFFKDTTYTKFSDWINNMQNEKLYFELAEEELIPLADVLSPIHVEPNGTLEFVNEHNLDIPTKVIYKKTV